MWPNEERTAQRAISTRSWTLSIAALATAFWFFPSLTDALIYDRAAIQAGEIWRLWSGHLVHFSASHFWLDGTAFLLCGWLLETRTHRSRPLYFLGAPAVISLTLFAFVPDMARYGGLSAFVMATLVYIALTIVRQGPVSIGWTVLVVLGAKTGYELIYRSSLFASLPSVSVAPASHLAGAAFGLLVAIAGVGKGTNSRRGAENAER